MAPDLHFKHYTLGEARLPAEVIVNLPDILLEAVALCADLEHNVFNPNHTDSRAAAALQETYWYLLTEWSRQALQACSGVGKDAEMTGRRRAFADLRACRARRDRGGGAGAPGRLRLDRRRAGTPLPRLARRRRPGRGPSPPAAPGA